MNSRSPLPLMPLLLASLLAPAGCSTQTDNTLFSACIRRTACGVAAYPRVNDCAVINYKTLVLDKGLAPVFDPILRCAAVASTCDALKACFGATQTCDSTYKAQCSGGKAMACDLLDHTTRVYDCAGAGLGCTVASGGAFDAYCDAGAAPDKSGGLPTSVDCGGGFCSDTGEACASTPFDRCKGEDLQSCLDGRWVQFSCKSLGLGPCYTTSSGTPYGSCGLPQ